MTGPTPTVVENVAIHVIRYAWPTAGRFLVAQYGLRRDLEQTVGVDAAIVALANRGTNQRALSPAPGTSRHIIIAAGPNAALDGSPIVMSWDRQAAERWGCELRPITVNGTLGNRSLCAPDTAASSHDGPTAVITRARVRPRALPHWHLRAGPATYRAALEDEALLAGAVFSEAPLVLGGTISFWPSNLSLRGFAYKRGSTHQQVMRQAATQDWVSESLFARLAVSHSWGTWDGCDPLSAYTDGTTAPLSAPNDGGSSS